MKGYQLIGKSAELDRECSRELSRWAATHLGVDDPDHWSLNYFPIGDGSAAVTRTVQGGPEYSRRGGTEVVTMMLVLDHEQFAAFEFNAIAVARTALAMGYLRLPQSQVPAWLPPISLPRHPITNAADQDDQPCRPMVDTIRDALKQAGPIAILGEPDPVGLMDKVVQQLPHDARMGLSFTTGLFPATSRPFRIHFVSRGDARTRRKLAAHGVTSLFSVGAAA